MQRGPHWSHARLTVSHWNELDEAGTWPPAPATNTSSGELAALVTIFSKAPIFFSGSSGLRPWKTISTLGLDAVLYLIGYRQSDLEE